jgi:hypothetical protein
MTPHVFYLLFCECVASARAWAEKADDPVFFKALKYFLKPRLDFPA